MLGLGWALSPYVAPTNKHFKVLNPIVGANPVLVMNALVRQKLAAKMLLHHPAMLKHSILPSAHAGASSQLGRGDIGIARAPVNESSRDRRVGLTASMLAFG